MRLSSSYLMQYLESSWEHGVMTLKRERFERFNSTWFSPHHKGESLWAKQKVSVEQEGGGLV